MSTMDELSHREHSLISFLIGFLVLFLELACIRWFSAYVIFLQFFTNVVLIACFLGMSCGCLAARRDLELARVVSLLALAPSWPHSPSYSSFTFGKGSRWMSAIRPRRRRFFRHRIFDPRRSSICRADGIDCRGVFHLDRVDVRWARPGARPRLRCLSQPLLGYTLNIGGSLAGIVGFSALSFAQARPVVWFLIGFAGIAYLLYQRRALSPPRVLALVTLLILVAVPRDWFNPNHETRWSPYYLIDRLAAHYRQHDEHQVMVPFEPAARHIH